MSEHDTDHPTGIDPQEATRWLQQLRAEMAASVNGSLLRGARPVQIGNTGSGSMTMRPTMSPGALLGYTLSANGVNTVPNAVRFRDRDGNLIAIADLTNGAGNSSYGTAWFGPGGINIPDGGLFIDVDDAVEGVVYLRGSD